MITVRKKVKLEIIVKLVITHLIILIHHNVEIENYLDAASEVGLYQSTNWDGRGVYIDQNSKLRNGVSGNIITSEKRKDTKLLNARSLATTPFKGADIQP